MIFEEIKIELQKSREKHGGFYGSHEGYAVLLEEIEELWAEVKKRKRDFEKMRSECIQIAAMAIKFAEDICDKQNIR